MNGDRHGTEHDELNNVSSNGLNGRPAPAIEVSTPYLHLEMCLINHRLY